MLSLRHTKEVIGAYITGEEMIYLCQWLYLLRGNAIYCETDAVIYILPGDEPNLLKRGTNCGICPSNCAPESTSEIVEWWAIELRVHCARYCDWNGRKSASNVWGITLNLNASNLVNFEVIRDMIFRGKGWNLPP